MQLDSPIATTGPRFSILNVLETVTEALSEEVDGLSCLTEYGEPCVNSRFDNDTEDPCTVCYHVEVATRADTFLRAWRRL